MFSLIHSLLTLFLFTGGLFAFSASSSTRTPLTSSFSSLSTSELEKRLSEIDGELEKLSSLSLRGGIGSIGYRSFWEDPIEWIEIELDQTYEIDEVVLVPCLWRHPTGGFQADAFPRKIHIIAGTENDREGSLVSQYICADEDSVGAGIAPVILETSGIKASWIRVEATELSTRNFDGRKVLQLAEILIFSGSENVALHRPVKCNSSDKRDMKGAWDERYLVDGFTPYIMDSEKGTSSTALVANIIDEASLVLDLGSKETISRIHLHAVEQNDTVPQAYAGDLGIPNQMLIEGSNSPDFSKSFVIFEYRRKSLIETGPIIILQFPEVETRYVRFTPIFQGIIPNPGSGREQLGFAEIEIFSDDVNVALGKPVTSKGLRPGERKLSALTDGNNLYGEILSIREWMHELADRGELETLRPLILAELNIRYERQQKLLTRMTQLVFLLLVGMGFTILIERYIRLKKVNQVRERIAADLHDELGANIHSIGLLSDLAQDSIDSREELKELLSEIREFTGKSGDAARYCTNILEARGICEDLVEEMKNFSNRALEGVEHEVSFEGETFLSQINPHKRVDLYLFYKECLMNILRHSRATRVITKVVADKKAVCITVTDNGKGLSSLNGEVPFSLKRRAKLLGAKVTAYSPPSGGTKISLLLKIRKYGFLK